MRFLRNSAFALALSIASMAGFIGNALAQVYPSTTPTYIPTALLPAATLTAAGSVVFQTNGQATLLFRVAGTNTGVAATIQGTEQRGGTPAWTNLGVQVVGGAGRITNVIGNGLYKVNVAGFAQVRLNLTAISSGSIVVTASAGQGEDFLTTIPAVRASFSAAASIGTGATTHFLSMIGSATKTVRITKAECSGMATAAVSVSISGELASTADSGDAGTTVTATAQDSTNVAATSVVKSHTTSPTSGTLIGLVRAGVLTLPAIGGTPLVPARSLRWTFGDGPGEQPIVLRGIAQSFSLNTGAAFGSGAAVGCSLTWTEE